MKKERGWPPVRGLPIFIVGFALVVGSCQDFFLSLVGHSVDVVWRVSIQATDGEGWYQVVDGVAYVPEKRAANGAFSAIDLETGKRKWRTERIMPSGTVSEMPLIVAGKIYLPSCSSENGNYYIARLDMATGERDMLIRLPGQAFLAYSELCGNGDLLFWESYACAPARMVRLDLSTLTDLGGGLFEGNPTQSIVLPGDPAYSRIVCSKNLASDECYAYLAWHCPGNEPGSDYRVGGLCKVDYVDETIVWNVDTYGFWPSNPLKVGSTIYFQGGDGLKAVDDATGQVLWTNRFAWGNYCGYTYQGGRLFLSTTAAHTMDDDPATLPGVEGGYCVDATTGKTIWSFPRNDEYGRGINPQVANGVCYVPTSYGIELYDAANGKSFALCSNVKSDPWMLIRSWKYVASGGKEYLLVDTTSELIAVKMNWTMGFWGPEKRD